MKKIISFLLAFVLIAGVANIMSVQGNVTFSDVKADTEVGKAVYKMANAGYVNGYPDGTFRPNNFIKRAEIVKLINVVFSYTEAGTKGFLDVKSNFWGYNNILIGTQAGYINGYPDGNFKPNANVTREQVCKILNAVMGFSLLPFNEKINDKISQWAVNDVNIVVSNRIIPIEIGGKFRATEKMTRGEVCLALSKFFNESSVPTETPSGSGGSGGSTTPKPTPTETPTPTPDIPLKAELKRVSYKLKTYVVIESSLTLGGKNIIRAIYESMDLYLAHPSYDYKTAASQNYAEFNKLSPKEQEDIKIAIQMWNNTSDLIALKEWFFPGVELLDVNG